MTTHGILRRVRTGAIVLLLVAAASSGGTYLVRQRLAAQAFIDVGDAVLTAGAVPVGTADAGVVTDLLVGEQTKVAAGQELAHIKLTANSTGQSQVPYDQVYGQYKEQAGNALKSDYIPQGYKDLVRDYFSSIEPGK